MERNKAMQRHPVRQKVIFTAFAALAALMAFLASIEQSSAQGLPPMPFIYSGSATIDGTPVPDGYTVHAQVGEYTSMPVAITDGRYALLSVTPSDSSFSGTEISFFMADVPANEKDVFVLAGTPVMNLNFDLTFPNLPVPTPTPTPIPPTPTETPRVALPAAYSGTIIVAGMPVPENATLVARIGGDYESLPAVVDRTTGAYNLVIAPNEFNLLGRTVTFFLNGVASEMIDTYRNGAFVGNFPLIFTGLPMPTATPTPTATPMPTNTPVPTPVPMNTPVPTTAPTATPMPMNTPVPTTATPVPTNTPVPTAAPTASVPPSATASTVVMPPTATATPVTAALAATPTQSAVPDGQGGGACGSTFSHTPPLTGLGNMLMLMAPLGLVVVMRRVRRNR